MDNLDSTFRVRPSTRHRGQPTEQRGVRLIARLPGASGEQVMFIPKEHIITVADALVDTIENEEI